jgi:hypothetical protein
MSTTNDITGDHLITKPTTTSYRSGWDLIFSKAFTFIPHVAPQTKIKFDSIDELWQNSYFENYSKSKWFISMHQDELLLNPYEAGDGDYIKSSVGTIIKNV